MQNPPANVSDPQFFRDAFNASPIGIVVESLEGQPLFVNAAFCSFLGFSEEEIRRKHCTDFSPREDAEKDWELFQKLKEGLIDNYQLDKRYFRRDGSLVWGRLSLSLLNHRPAPLVIAMVEDITEKKASQHREHDLLQTLELVTTQMAAAVTRCSRDLHYLWVNQRYADWLGCPLQRIVNRPVAEILGKEAFDSLLPHFERVLAGENVTYEQEVNYPGVGKRWISAAYTPTFTHDGVADGWVAVVHDITERKHAEHLRFRHAAILESSNDAIISKSLDGVVTSWNTGAERTFGYTEAEVVGQPIAILIPPELHDEETRLLGTLRSGGRIEHYETVRVTKTGQKVDVSLTIGPIKDSTGEMLGYCKIAHDITERKRGERAVKESEQRFRLVADSAPVLIWMSGTDKLCTYFNKPWLDFTGRGFEQELGDGWAEGVHQKDLGRCLKTYSEAFDKREPFEMEYRMLRHDGEYRWLFDVGVPRFSAQGTFVGYIGSCVDITERMRAEEALATMGRKLIEAHEQERIWIGRELHDDINQQLALLAVELDRWSREPRVDENQAAHFAHAQRQIGDISRDVHALSHRLHSSKLDYLGLVVAAGSFCKELSEKARVAVQFKHSAIPSTIPKEVSLCLFRVLQEALQNAVKYSGVRNFDVNLRGTPEGIELAVSDIGSGFESEHAFSSNGLGLISMRERLQMVNGVLDIKTRPGAGTTICARVPLQIPEHRAMAG